MKALARLSPALLALALLTGSGVWGQILTGKGFTADPNGYRSDEPLASPQQKVAPGTVIKDCPECPEMVVLPGGSFLMGSPPDPAPDPFSNEKPKANGLPEEKPQHRVQIQSFAIGKYEVTQEQWYAVMGNNPSQNKGRTLPVEQVSWDDIQQFIEKLNQKAGQKYRLPSEAEWEYAARAGTTTEWSHGNDESKLGNYAWYNSERGGKTQAVGQKLPNAFGLFDMHGNVWEWTQDCWHGNYSGAPTDGSAWVTGCSGNYRVLRGGSWNNGPANLRSVFRFCLDPHTPGIHGILNGIAGFRLARTFTDTQTPPVIKQAESEKVETSVVSDSTLISQTQAGQDWVRQMPAGTFLVQHTIVPSYAEANAYMQAHPNLKRARIVANYLPNQAALLFSVVSGPFGSLADASAYADSEGVPKDPQIRSARFMKEQFSQDSAVHKRGENKR